MHVVDITTGNKSKNMHIYAMGFEYASDEVIIAAGHFVHTTLWSD